MVLSNINEPGVSKCEPQENDSIPTIIRLQIDVEPWLKGISRISTPLSYFRPRINWLVWRDHGEGIQSHDGGDWHLRYGRCLHLSFEKVFSTRRWTWLLCTTRSLRKATVKSADSLTKGFKANQDIPVRRFTIQRLAIFANTSITIPCNWWRKRRVLFALQMVLAFIPTIDSSVLVKHLAVPSHRYLNKHVIPPLWPDLRLHSAGYRGDQGVTKTYAARNSE